MIEIKTGDIPCCVYVSEVLTHKEIKIPLLHIFNNNGTFGLDVGDEYPFGQRTYNTDWHLQSSFHYKHIEYERIIDPIINNHNEALTKFLGYTEPITCDNKWFQQYKKNDFHGWHRHKHCIFSNVYYLDLPYKVLTSFRFHGREFTIEIKEGQILTFPSFLEHSSKPNFSDKIKTVISFNSS